MWDNPAMSKMAVDIERLTRDEQLDLLDRLWESLGRDPEAFPLSEEQKTELDRRLAELEQEGPVGMSWDEAVAEIRARPR